MRVVHRHPLFGSFVGLDPEREVHERPGRDVRLRLMDELAIEEEQHLERRDYNE